MYAMFTGFLFGATNTLVGHPMDTIKTKMQADTGYIGMKSSLMGTIKHLYKAEGVIGFYRGCVPPFFGSVIYRSLQFTVYESLFTLWKDNDILTQKIPHTMGLEYRVPLSGFIAASSRAALECPFEYAKVRRQTH
jgi:solute carrier family 25 carnitine/acylcarnitine transporter 20/29